MAEPAFKAKKARKSKVVLRINIQGPSGSGKTKGALRLARGLAELVAVEKGRKPSEARLAGIDTENESMLLYADEIDFDHVPFDPPFHAARYKAAIKQQVDDGYDVIVLDSASHWWKSVLSRKEALDVAGGNSFTNWGKMTPEVEDLVEYIKHVPVHIIVCARSKTEFVLMTNDKGKQAPVKVGMKPVLKEDMDYEFDLVFEVDAEHRALATKDRTNLFAPKGEAVDLFDPNIAVLLHEWATSGKDAEIRKITHEDRIRVFGAVKRFEIDPEAFRSYLMDTFGINESTDIPASQVSNVLRWLESPDAKLATSSPEEKQCRETAALIGLSTNDRAILFQKFSNNWPKVLQELNILADTAASGN